MVENGVALPGICRSEVDGNDQPVLQGGNMNGSDAPPASMVNKITWSRYVTLDLFLDRY
jgi:hypothetical protein